jgi:lipopolysaccharide heptosyltransferase II
MKSLVKKFKNAVIKKAFRLSEEFHLVRKFSPDPFPSKFLIVSATGVGDTLWGTPAIRALRETYPQGCIGVLTSPAGFEILKRNPDIDEFFVFRRGAKGIISLPFMLKKMRMKKFEVAFIFHSSDRILWPICYLAGPSERIGLEAKNKGLDFVLTKCVPNPQSVHGVEKRLNLVKEMGVHPHPARISIYLDSQDRQVADRFLEAHGIDRRSPLIGLHPGAQKPFKCWPARNFVAVGNKLGRKFGSRVIITGDEQEKGLAEEVASRVKNAVSAAGKLSLRGTAALIEKMQVFITNDTGPMHIASALKTPTVALFSPTDPGVCGPYLDGQSIVIQKPKTCSPCAEKNCDHPICMDQITPEEVIEAAERILESDKDHENSSSRMWKNSIEPSLPRRRESRRP